jgi:hypothetical protein
MKSVDLKMIGSSTACTSLKTEKSPLQPLTGDNIRLGLLTKEDLEWEFTFELPRIEETS